MKKLLILFLIPTSPNRVESLTSFCPFPSNYNRDDQIKKEVIMVVFNKTKRSGVKKPFRLEEIWRIRTR
ncbi:hypothetical protein AB6E09_14775, partial [Vibrio lentus]